MNEKPALLISACLLGICCRYDGKSKPHPIANELKKHYRLIPCCPESAGGLPIPRVPSERQSDGTVKNRDGVDVTAAYRKGAACAEILARRFSCVAAVLKEKSPSCGTAWIHDGSFDGKQIPGRGVTAEVLARLGIPLYSEETAAALLSEPSDS